MGGCQVLITRGKNKGKTCGSVNAKCKHVTELMECDVCHMKFDRSTSYYRHRNAHQDGPKVKPTPTRTTHSAKPMAPTPVPPSSLPSPSDPPDSPKPERDVYIRLLRLEEQNDALRKEVEVLKHKPMTTNNYIAIVGSNFYTELIEKIGKNDAIKFLTGNCVKSPLSVFQKLYLDDRSPDDYPVACKDELHFRYLDSNKRVIDDCGGTTIGSVMSQQITDAVLHAAADFEIEGQGNSVYGLDHIRKIRERFAELDKDTMIRDLAYITNNPNHPFFRE